jgi:hypothetical protein
MAQHTQISKCNTASKRKQGQNHIIIPIDAEKPSTKFNILYDENSEKLGVGGTL